MPFWNSNRYFLSLISIYVVGWSIWVFIGYPQFYEGSLPALFLNVLLKIVSFLIFIALLENGSKPKNRLPIQEVNFSRGSRKSMTDHDRPTE